MSVFYDNKFINKLAFLRACVQQIGPVVAVTHYTTNNQLISSSEILFTTDEALTNGVTIQKKTLFNPTYSLWYPKHFLSNIIEPLGQALSAFGIVAQICAYLIPISHIFEGQAIVLLDVSTSQSSFPA